jgi:glyoxylase-like metal-dependent hydrolase (beta-lactamase superfamily II)
MKVGAAEVLPVLDGTLVSKVGATKPLPDPGSLTWQEQHGTFRADGMMVSTLGAFLVRTGDRVVLIDAGSGQEFPGGYRPPVLDLSDESDELVGTYRRRGLTEDDLRRVASDLGRIELTQGRLPGSMEGIGVRPEDVTDVMFTHLHFDHIGWASAQGTPFFPNATIRCAAADLDYFLPGSPDDGFSARVFGSLPVPVRLQPVLDRIETWDADATVLPGIDVRMTPGHTPGSSVVVVSSGAHRAMLLGDVVHCPLELQDDEFNLLADHDLDLARQVREALARELEGTQIPIAAAHFPGLQFGRLLPGQGVRRWVFSDE